MSGDVSETTARRWDLTRHYIVKDSVPLEHETLGVLLFGSRAEAERYIRDPWPWDMQEINHTDCGAARAEETSNG